MNLIKPLYLLSADYKPVNWMEIEQDTLNFINMFENKKNYKLEDRKGRILISGMGGWFIEI